MPIGAVADRASSELSWKLLQSAAQAHELEPQLKPWDCNHWKLYKKVIFFSTVKMLKNKAFLQVHKRNNVFHWNVSVKIWHWVCIYFIYTYFIFKLKFLLTYLSQTSLLELCARLLVLGIPAFYPIRFDLWQWGHALTWRWASLGPG